MFEYAGTSQSATMDVGIVFPLPIRPWALRWEALCTLLLRHELPPAVKSMLPQLLGASSPRFYVFGATMWPSGIYKFDNAEEIWFNALRVECKLAL